MIFYVCYPSQQIINCTNILQSLGIQNIESKCWKNDVLDKVIGRFEVAFDEDRVNTWCHCMLHYALEDKLLHVLCCCSDGIIDVQDSISSMWCPDDYWHSGLVWYMVQYHKRYEISHYQSWCVCEKCNDTSWDYTDCSCMIASCMFCAGVLTAWVMCKIASLLCGVHIPTTRGGAIIAPQHFMVMAIFEMVQ